MDLKQPVSVNTGFLRLEIGVGRSFCDNGNEPSDLLKGGVFLF
jgi:hypothetical protein